MPAVHAAPRPAAAPRGRRREESAAQNHAAVAAVHQPGGWDGRNQRPLARGAPLEPKKSKQNIKSPSEKVTCDGPENYSSWVSN